MGANTHIEWADHTFNPWEGCTKVSPGCEHCYAETRNKRFSAGANWGKGAPRRRTSVQNWNQVKKWERSALEASQLFSNMPWFKDRERHRPRVFCASLADWLDDEVPIEWVADLMDLIRATPNLDWLLLTKRPENWNAAMRAVGLLARGCSQFAKDWLAGIPPANVWVGWTAEDQQRLDERTPLGVAIPAVLHFVSCEPLLHPLDLTRWLHPEGRCGECEELIRVDRTSVNCDCCVEGPEQTLTRNDLLGWVICGGESGSKARPMHPDWARALRDQCAIAGVPFFFKQWGEWIPWTRELEYADGTETGHVMLNGSKYQPDNFSSPLQTVVRVGKNSAGCLLDGKIYQEFPAE